jgi:hypothetical protein
MTLGSSVRRISLWCVLAGAVLLSACGKEPSRPPVTDVQFAATATPDVGDPSAPVSVRALVVNAGRTRVLHCSGCGCGNGIGIRILGPDGDEVALRDPNAPRLACADSDVPLESGKSLDRTDLFTGVLYERGLPTYPSPTYAAPPGTYTVIATFAYSPPTGERVAVERRTTFDWRP